MFRVLAAASLLSIVAAPAVAQSSSSAVGQPQPVASTDKSDVNKIVCKKEEKLGSRLGGKKVCLTVQEWEDMAKAARDDTEAVQRGARTSPSG
jgi:hypothetical protein